MVRRKKVNDTCMKRTHNKWYKMKMRTRDITDKKIILLLSFSLSHSLSHTLRHTHTHLRAHTLTSACSSSYSHYPTNWSIFFLRYRWLNSWDVNNFDIFMVETYSRMYDEFQPMRDSFYRNCTKFSYKGCHLGLQRPKVALLMEFTFLKISQYKIRKLY